MVKTSKGAEVLCRNVGSILGADQGISVSWVAHNNDSSRFFAYTIQDLALGFEDCSIGLEQVCSFHAWSPRPSSNQDSEVYILEAHFRISSRHDTLEEWISTVLQLEDLTVENSLCHRELNQLQNDALVRAKHVALSDKVVKVSTNLTGGACHSHSHSVR